MTGSYTPSEGGGDPPVKDLRVPSFGSRRRRKEMSKNGSELVRVITTGRDIIPIRQKLRSDLMALRPGGRDGAWSHQRGQKVRRRSEDPMMMHPSTESDISFKGATSQTHIFERC